MSDEKTTETAPKAPKTEAGPKTEAKKTVTVGTPVPLKGSEGALSANTNATANYHDHVVEGTGLVKQLARDSLMFYWKFGQLLQALVVSPAKYGTKGLETYLADVNKNLPEDLQVQKSLAYMMVNFSKKLTENQLAQLQNKCVSWSQARQLVDGSLSDDARSQIIADVNTSKLSPDSVEDAVDRLTKKSSGKAKAGKATPKPLTVIKGAIELFTHMADKLDGIGNAFKDIFEGDSPEDMKTAKGLLKELKDCVEVATDKGTKELGRADAALAKTKEVTGKGK